MPKTKTHRYESATKAEEHQSKTADSFTRNHYSFWTDDDWMAVFIRVTAIAASATVAMALAQASTNPLLWLILVLLYVGGFSLFCHLYPQQLHRSVVAIALAVGALIGTIV